MNLYNVQIVGATPLAPGKYRLIEYVVSASTSAQAQANAVDDFRSSPHRADKAIRCVYVEPTGANGVLCMTSRDIDQNELARIEADPGVYRITQEHAS